MAKIEMDVSEYEAMKENKRLLEQSLERERELKDQVDKLNDEKIQAVEDAQKKVVKIRKKTITEHKVVKRPYDDIVRNFYAWYSERDMFRGVYSEYEQERNLNRLIDWMFDTVTSETDDDGIEEVTTHGLEQVKHEIAEEYKASMDKKYAQRLEDAKEALEVNNKLHEKISELRTEYDQVSSSNEFYSKRTEELTKENNELEEFIESIGLQSNKIHSLVSEEFHIFNAYSKLKRIHETVKDSNLRAKIVQFMHER